MKIGKFNLGTTEMVLGALVVGGVGYMLWKRSKKKGEAKFVNASGNVKRKMAKPTTKKKVKKIKPKTITKGGMPKVKRPTTFAWYTIKTDTRIPTKVLTIGTRVIGGKPKVNKQGKMVVTLYGVYRDKKNHLRNVVVPMDRLSMLRYMPMRRYQLKQNVLVSNSPKKVFRKGAKISGIPYKKGKFYIVRVVNAYRLPDGKFRNKDIPMAFLTQIPTKVAPKVEKKSKPLTPSKKLLKPMRLDRMPMKKP